MARFRASKAAPATTSSAEAAHRAAERVPFTPPRKAVSRPDPVEMVVDSIVREMIPVAGADDRFDRLLERVQIRTRDEALGTEAVRAAAALRCRMPEGTWGTEVVVTQTIARFLAAEAAVTGRFDPRAALRRANVDRYLEEQRGYGSRSLHTRLWMLYAAGRIFHPGEYPRERAIAPRTKHVPPASTVEVAQLLALVPTLSAVVGRRLQTVVDLCWGVGARRADFRYLQGTAISTRRWQGKTVALVELRNNAGGTRTVPAFKPDLVERLGRLSDYAGDGLVLAPHKKTTQRNEVNRIAEALRRLGHPGVNPVALRHRWMLDMAERLPAALVLQLADVVDLKVISDYRRLTTYRLAHALTMMGEAFR
ncbi:hypothetical protein LCL87_23285 [Rhodococcus hoagii]|nr:hypothetical protein [Prescottella equi]